MYIINYLVTSTIFLLSCGQANSDKVVSTATDTIPKTNPAYQDKSFFSKVYFSQTDAELILGEKAYRSDSSSTIKKDTLEIKRAYTANSIDQKTGETGVIYFMIEEYNQEASAKKAYDFFKTANEKNEGIKIVHDMGDDAYFHSDGKNFYFILVRKGKKMFGIKVNKITSFTSLKEFNLVSKKISDAL